MATIYEKRQAKSYHSLTFFIPPAETVYYSDGVHYNDAGDLFDDEPRLDSVTKVMNANELFDDEPQYSEDQFEEVEITPSEVNHASQYFSSETMFDDTYVDLSNYRLGVNPKNTWYNWHLVPSSRPVFNPPTLATHYVEIPGYNGYLDLTKALSNNIAGAREGSINFYVMNDYGHWEERFNELLSYIHGNLLRVVLDDNPYYYYEGRWHVEEWTNNNDGICSSVTFGYHLQPGRIPIP